MFLNRYDRYEITSAKGANNVVSGKSPGQYGPGVSNTSNRVPACVIGGTGIGTSHAVCNDRVACGAAALSGCADACGTVAMNSVNVGGCVGTGNGAVCEGGTARCCSGGAIAVGTGASLR